MDCVRIVHPIFQSGDGGSLPTSALQFWFSAVDLDTAKALNRLWHSRFPDTGGGGSRVCYAAEYGGLFYATAIWTNPTSPKLPQRSWLMLKRFAIAPDAPKNTASRMMKWMNGDIRRRFPEVETLVSYSDPDTHQGTIYKVAGWEKGKTTKRTIGSKQWHNRERGSRTKNSPCEWVTRWTKSLR
jgi:hypothetical protein